MLHSTNQSKSLFFVYIAKDFIATARTSTKNENKSLAEKNVEIL